MSGWPQGGDDNAYLKDGNRLRVSGPAAKGTNCHATSEAALASGDGLGLGSMRPRDPNAANARQLPLYPESGRGTRRPDWA
eukprot:6175691-Prymnesium_polylepis.2